MKLCTSCELALTCTRAKSKPDVEVEIDVPVVNMSESRLVIETGKANRVLLWNTKESDLGSGISTLLRNASHKYHGRKIDELKGWLKKQTDELKKRTHNQIITLLSYTDSKVCMLVAEYLLNETKDKKMINGFMQKYLSTPKTVGEYKVKVYVLESQIRYVLSIRPVHDGTDGIEGPLTHGQIESFWSGASVDDIELVLWKFVLDLESLASLLPSFGTNFVLFRGHKLGAIGDQLCMRPLSFSFTPSVAHSFTVCNGVMYAVEFPPNVPKFILVGKVSFVASDDEVIVLPRFQIENDEKLSLTTRRNARYRFQGAIARVIPSYPVGSQSLWMTVQREGKLEEMKGNVVRKMTENIVYGSVNSNEPVMPWSLPSLVQIQKNIDILVARIREKQLHW